MASVQNRANPMSEYGEVRTDLIRSTSGSFTNATISGRLSGLTTLSATTVSGIATLAAVTGSFTSVAAAPALRLSTTNTAVASGSMGVGDIIIATGAGGGTATLYVKLASGSVNAIWTVAGVYATAST